MATWYYSRHDEEPVSFEVEDGVPCLGLTAPCHTCGEGRRTVWINYLTKTTGCLGNWDVNTATRTTHKMPARYFFFDRNQQVVVKG